MMSDAASAGPAGVLGSPPAPAEGGEEQTSSLHSSARCFLQLAALSDADVPERLKPAVSLTRGTQTFLTITLCCPVKVSVAASNPKVAIRGTTTKIWPVSGDMSACHGPASAPSQREQRESDWRFGRHKPPLQAGGRSFAFLLCRSEESTKIPENQLPFLLLQTCSDNDGAAESREAAPPQSQLWDGAHWEQTSVECCSSRPACGRRHTKQVESHHVAHHT